MLKEFSVKNFLSFKEEVSFSMEALTDSVTEYLDNVSKINDNEILKVASIYGPNASGKSNLLKAIMFFKSAVLSNFSEFSSNDITNKNLDALNQFVFTDKENNKTYFKFFSVNEKYEFGYELELSRLKDDFVVISYESMSFKDADMDEFIGVYERIGHNIELSDGLEKVLSTKEFNISNQVSVLSFINTLYVKKGEDNPGYLDLIANFYSEISSIIIIKSFRDMKNKNAFLSFVYKQDNFKQFVVKKLNDFDIRIKDIEIDDSDGKFKFNIIREIDKEIYSLDLYSESDGTLSLIYLLPMVYSLQLTSKILLVDELDAHLHPKLTREIVKSFQSKTNKNAQLIFTSHDITNMDNDLFRRDEIWFVVKDEKYSSDIFSLTDIVNYKGEKVRKDAKFNKQYLEGRYGADPFIKKDKKWND